MTIQIYDEIGEFCYCSKDFNREVQKLDGSDDKELTVEINSCGGDVFEGVAIANKIRELSRQNGVRTIAKITGIAASIASVIACACDEIVMYKSSFMMIHNAWTMTCGNSEELRKQAAVMDTINAAIMSFYKGKFDKSEDEIKTLMDAETWFSGLDVETFKFHAQVLDDEVETKIAASLNKYNFKNIPNGLINLMKDENTEQEEVKEEVINENTEVQVSDDADNEEQKEEVVSTEEETQNEPTEPQEQSADEPDDTDPQEDEKKEDDDVEMVSKEECEKRVSGMQSVMAKKIDAVKNDFMNQLKVKDEELTKANAKITSLTDDFERASKELSDVKDELLKLTSTLQDKSNALAVLNANVNKPKDNAPVNKEEWRDLKGEEFFAWLKKYNANKH